MGGAGALLGVPAADIPKCIESTFHFRFQELEGGVCFTEPPSAPLGGDNFVLVLVKGNSQELLVQVGSAAACGDRQAWYYEDRTRSFLIRGSPAMCQLARAALSEPDVDFLVLYACPPVAP